MSRQLATLPAEESIQRVQLFSSLDDRLSLHIFTTADANAADEARFDARASDAEREAAARHQAYVRDLLSGAFLREPAGRHAPPLSGLTWHTLEAFLGRCPASYVTSHVPRLLVKQRHLYELVAGTDDVAVDLERLAASSDAREPPSALLTLATRGVTPRGVMRRVLPLLDMHDLSLHRAAVHTIAEPDESEERVTLLRTVVRPKRSRDPSAAQRALAANAPPAEWERLIEAFRRDAQRCKWVPDRALELAAASGGAVQLLESEVVVALADVSLAVLDHPLLTKSTVHELLCKTHVTPHAAALSRLLISRFDAHAPLSADALEAALSAEMASVERAIGDEPPRQLLRAMASAVRHTMRTNLRQPERWALSLRLQPDFFSPALPPPPQAAGGALSNLPYGVFFVGGRHFNGYHVRFADIARGGLRVVLPPSREAHVAESTRHFNECCMCIMGIGLGTGREAPPPYSMRAPACRCLRASLVPLLARFACAAACAPRSCRCLRASLVPLLARLAHAAACAPPSCAHKDAVRGLVWTHRLPSMGAAPQK